MTSRLTSAAAVASAALLAASSFAAVALAAGTGLPQHYNKALVVVGHPDDAECLAGGAIRLLVEDNTEVAYIVATNGDKGWGKSYNMTPAELTQIRMQEQLNAAAVLGVSNVTFLGYEDGGLVAVPPLTLQESIVKVIRTFQPDLVLTFSPNMDPAGYQYGLVHRDHLTTGAAALDAVWPAARNWMTFPDLFQQGLLPWIVPEVWTFSFQQVAAQDVLLDITSVFQTKCEAMLQHQSQYSNGTAVTEELWDQGVMIASKNGFSNPLLPMEAFTRIIIDS